MNNKREFVVAIMCCVLFVLAIQIAKSFTIEPLMYSKKSVQAVNNVLVSVAFFLIYKYSDFEGYLLEKLCLRNVIINSLLLVFAVYLVINESLSKEAPLLYYIEFISAKMSTGLVEETLFRGIIFVLIFKYFGLKKGVFYTAFIFAVFHLINYINGSISLNDVIVQMIYAFGTGSLFAAIYLKQKSLITISLIHGYLNIFLGGAEKGTEISNTISIGAIAFFTIVSFVLMIFANMIIKKEKEKTFEDFVIDFSK